MSWEPKASQNARAIRLFVDSIGEIGDALRLPSDPVVGHMGSAARRVSIQLRKLLFDGSPLFHAVLVRPRLHPLVDRGTLAGDVYENAFQVSIAPASSKGVRLGAVSTHTWKVAVHPLHGLQFDQSEKTWMLRPMFNTGAAPVTMDRWLRQRLFSVDGREYSLSDTLKYLANKEAAHVDTERTSLSKDMERIHFGNTCYYHIVTLLTGAYILDQFHLSTGSGEATWRSFLDRRGVPINDSGTFKGADLAGAQIDPLGLPYVFEGSGIPLPSEDWTPVHLEDSAVVRP